MDNPDLKGKISHSALQMYLNILAEVNDQNPDDEEASTMDDHIQDIMDFGKSIQLQLDDLFENTEDNKWESLATFGLKLFMFDYCYYTTITEKL